MRAGCVTGIFWGAKFEATRPCRGAACHLIRRIVLAQIIAFPRAGKPATPNAEAGLSAEVHRLLPPGQTTALTHVETAAPATPPLSELVAQMRADTQELTRSMAELQRAVGALAEADLPGQARALAAAVVGDTRG
jgi:hypothetical protein